ncbi:MAG: enoyl-CoA hydratase [Frankiales bacterium]|nr:enoyl-CoA hydratase [Frankiales bacterium]
MPDVTDPIRNPIQYELRDRTAWVTLSQPDRGNPIDMALAVALCDVVERARRDDVHVLVLQAEGKAFSVGGDIAAMGAADEPGPFIRALADTLHQGIAGLLALDAIVVSVVRGTAAGAGFPLAAAADVVLASSDARFTLAYTKIGLSPDGGSSLLTTTLGLHRALQYALLNPLLSAADLQAAGVIAQVHPAEDLDAAVEKVVTTLRSGSRAAQVSAKRLLRDKVAPDPIVDMDRETDGISTAAASPDGREGVRAFLDKRPPQFPSSQ